MALATAGDGLMLTCCECGRQMRQAAAYKATRVLGGGLKSAGPLGPKCARKGLLMLPVASRTTKRAALLSAKPKRRHVEVTRDERQLDWLESISA